MNLYKKYFNQITAADVDNRQKVMAIKRLTSIGKEQQPKHRRLAEEFAPRFALILSQQTVSTEIKVALIKSLGAFGIKFYAAMIASFLEENEADLRGAAVLALDCLDARGYYVNIEKLKFDTAQCQLKDDYGRIDVVSVGQLVQDVLHKWDFINKKHDNF